MGQYLAINEYWWDFEAPEYASSIVYVIVIWVESVPPMFTDMVYVSWSHWNELFWELL